ncbi:MULTISPECIES: NAD(P)/FAD-dependent oxidoreductase [Rhodococcus]|uniref:FAD dependent oxidoreductase n=1 Tax=Rhodococcus opacus RKJ300 = JCM 13270 TaxID=1165867 RepID=I0WLZ2_RHOOP|nr:MULTISPECIES: tryptophan 7-halogenase [Rhodococcus]EID77408.1 FAD dependent oxidoreductase [Rhodococcus opacus RKJ300 = JCM 13270]QQZ18435.1 tryptophan 7-halogenase [Rhodococcus sp. 21391]
MSSAVDLLIVGAGPAGTAAAISAATAGLRVRVLERSTFPRHRPGETLHPGVGPVLAQLGVAEQVAAAAGARHNEQAVDWRGHSTVTAFGVDADGPWRGYQVDRAALDELLLDRARVLGVEVCQPERAGAPRIDAGRVVGAGRHAARFVVDAGGGRGWLRRHLQLPLHVASPPLRAYYGYCQGSVGPVPCLVGDRDGWTWTAQVASEQVHWTRLAFPGTPKPDCPPPCLAARPAIGRVRGADVTWRHVPASAGPGYFLAGDAAAVLDPAAHGVLRALLSGIAVAHTAVGVHSAQLGEELAARLYRDWLASWFAHDVKRLSDLYRQLQPTEGTP